MSKLEVELQAATADSYPLCIRVLDPDLIGKVAQLRVQLKAVVKDSRPVNAARELHSQTLTLSSALLHAEIPREVFFGVYDHVGDKLELHVVTQIKVDDGILFDTEVEHRHDFPLGDQPRVARDDPKLMDPADAFSFVANLAALPYRNRVIVLALSVLGGLLMLGNLLLGVHDEFVPEVQTFLYDHRGSDGSESPFMKALAGSGALGAALWAAIRVQLRKYMRLVLKRVPALRRDTRIALADLIEGESRVPLRNVLLRVIACNRECGQYKRGSGSKERTVSFRTPVRAVKLYEQQMAIIPANTPITMYFNGEVDFAPMFADLYPPLLVGANHGIDVSWEVQLLHPEFVDHELPGDVSSLRYADFLAD